LVLDFGLLSGGEVQATLPIPLTGLE